MNIGASAKTSGISAKMIRYCEEIHLIPQPDRTASGYRAYDTKDVQMLRFVRRARDLSFSMERNGELLALWRDQDRASGDVKRLALAQVAGLRQKIADMEDMARTLEHSPTHATAMTGPTAQS